MRILLIDDDKDDQSLFCEALAQISTDIVCELADSGVHGLELLNSAKTLPDIIFLDINMPLMDGRETLTVIRSKQRLQNIPVVMYSTSIASSEVSWFEKMNAAYITKPNDFTHLTQLLSDHLKKAVLTKRNYTITQR
jgi:CheY-like chemotaxis protein